MVREHKFANLPPHIFYCQNFIYILMPKPLLYCTLFVNEAGMIQYDLVGWGTLPALVPSCVVHVCCPLASAVYLNSNCCKQFTYHDVVAQITACISFCLYVSLVYHEKSTHKPLHPFWSELGGVHILFCNEVF